MRQHIDCLRQLRSARLQQTLPCRGCRAAAHTPQAARPRAATARPCSGCAVCRENDAVGRGRMQSCCGERSGLSGKAQSRRRLTTGGAWRAVSAGGGGACAGAAGGRCSGTGGGHVPDSGGNLWGEWEGCGGG
ncbi:hypothetical protein PMAC_000438 [Pneumocystis sp. 'macacae']|nr:hypothetical protein PMAC_000438 [Pneumocystis sp. 'macacae']